MNISNKLANCLQHKMQYDKLLTTFFKARFEGDHNKDEAKHNIAST
jgi:hypothetical protein